MQIAGSCGEERRAQRPPRLLRALKKYVVTQFPQLAPCSIYLVPLVSNGRASVERRNPQRLLRVRRTGLLNNTLSRWKLLQKRANTACTFSLLLLLAGYHPSAFAQADALTYIREPR